ncbi:MAG TPA: hypothetical protein VGB78_06310 [Thermoplasmata archaeon]
MSGTEVSVKKRPKLEEIVVGASRWLAASLLAVLFVFAILVLVTTAMVAIYDLLVGHALFAGVGTVLALVGGILFAVSTFELINLPEKQVLKGNFTWAYYNLGFSPLLSAMRFAPNTFYDHSIIVMIAGFLEMLLGIIILG